MRNLTVHTNLGQVVFRCRQDCFDRGPIAVMFHGFWRDADHNGPWQDRLPYEVMFARLPGHWAPEISPSIDVWTNTFRRAIKAFPKPPVLAIGESLGALVALGLGLPTVAIEPFLSTEDLWPVENSIRNARRRGIDIPEPLVDAFFNGADHSPVLDRITAPALVLGGDVPLHPRRAGTQSPRLLEDADFEAFARHPMVEARRISGGHLLLEDSPETCRDLIVAHGARYGGAPLL